MQNSIKNISNAVWHIMFSVDEDTLKLIKLGTRINYENDTEIVEIPLKEYMDGRWHIVRLVEEVNK